MIEAVFSLPDSSWESSDLTQLWEVEMTTPQVGGPYLRVTRLAAECRGIGSIRQIRPRQRSGQMACRKHLLSIRKTHSAFQTVKQNAGEGKIFPSCFRLLARSQGRQSSRCPLPGASSPRGPARSQGRKGAECSQPTLVTTVYTSRMLGVSSGGYLGIFQGRRTLVYVMMFKM